MGNAFSQVPQPVLTTFDGIRGTTYDSAHRSFPMVGKTFAHYAVLEKAGAGGMGVVFRARDETLHRDVALKVLDFGLAMNIKDASFEGITRSTTFDSGGVAGTLAYLAPELLQGKAPDVRTDIWSLGVLLYELAAGVLPFQGRTGFELTTAILREAPAALPTHVSPGLRAVIIHCLSKEPEKRYQHASEIRAALEALQSDTGVAPRVALEPQRKSTSWYVFAPATVLPALPPALFVYGPINNPRTRIQPAANQPP